MVMAKKKTTKASKKTSSFSEPLDIRQRFLNERVVFILGIFMLLLSIFLIWAFISYFFTGEADQSMIETPRDGELLNQEHEFQNDCGSLGAYAAWFFIKRCFGLSAFLIPVFTFLVSVKLMRAYKVNLLKWFMCLGLVMVWGSVTMAKFPAAILRRRLFQSWR